MSNKEFLESLKNRLVYIYDVDPSSDYIIRLEKIIENFDKLERLQSILNEDYS